MTQIRSITETPNVLSSDVDMASSDEIVRILRQTDAQIFSGFLAYPGFYDEETLETLVQLAERASKTLSKPKGYVALAGAGTSGRLAMFEARAFNRLAATRENPEPFRYLMAGGDSALIQAQEGAEDDPHQAVTDLCEATAGATDIFYVGITCGMSAPYIAGQLEHMLTSSTKGHSVLLGFNPKELARNVAIEGWDGTFLDTVVRVDQSSEASILNPIIGPEPITGSTRMKSGSATKILLEVLFHTALALSQKKLKKSQARQAIIGMLRSYEQAYRSTYLSLPEIGELVELGGETLRSSGHIYYLGASGYDQNGRYRGGPDAGILGLVDASECPPTYGADFEDVRGFVLGGWKTLFPGKQKDYSSLGTPYRISVEDFRQEKLPSVGPKDLCVFLGEFEGRDALIEQVQAKGAKTAAVVWKRSSLPVDVTVQLEPVAPPDLGQGPLEFEIKLVLNALTTGGHVLAGKVYGNRMVDLRLSNNKLFFRTVGIISDLIHVSHEEATDALLRSVYKTDELKDEQRNAPVSEHIEASKKVDKVVPKALLLATGKASVKEATRILKRNPIVRQVIVEHLK